jgi:hypothetical protein
MLFDLKGKRKRFVQATYVALAFLFAVGLVGFGIGGATNGGILNVFGNGGGGSSGSSFFEKEAAKAAAAVRLHPRDKRAQLKLAEAKLNVARSGDDFDQTTGAFKPGAADELKAAAGAWEGYLALKPRKPSARVAQLMFTAYASLLQFTPSSVLATARKAAQAEEIVNAARPSPNGSFILARIYYFIGEFTKGDAAARKALRGTPPDQRNTVRAQLNDDRKQAIKAKAEARKQKQKGEKQAREQLKKGQDPFGTPGQSPLGL